MDGIFVAYHNTFEIFGFQYISREEIDRVLYGNSITGDAIFSVILQIYNEILREVNLQFPKQSIIRITMAIDKTAERLKIFADQLEGEGRENDEMGKNGNNGIKSSLQSYQLKCHFILNGIRTDNLVLKDSRDKWKMHFSLMKIKSDPKDYELVRMQLVESRYKASEDGDNQPSAFIRNAMRKSKDELSINENEKISAPWTFCK